MSKVQTRNTGKNTRQTPIAQGRVHKATPGLRSHAKPTPKTSSTCQTRANKLRSDQDAENEPALCEVIASDASTRKRKPLAERNLYVDVSPHDRTATRGTPLKKSTLNIFQPGQKGNLVDWSRFNKQHRKYLNHPLTKQFDDSRASYAEELQDVIDTRLNEVHQKLISALHNESGDVPLRSERVLDELANSIPRSNKVKPLSEETLPRTIKKANGTKETIVYTLQDRIDVFAAEVQKHEQIIAAVTKKHDDILHEIATFVAEKLDVEDDVDSGLDAKTVKMKKSLEQEIHGLGEQELQALKKDVEAEKVKKRKFYAALAVLDSIA